MANGPSVAIIGAGVVGLCTALEWLRAGYTVSLFDQESPASQTSFGNAAYLAAEYMDPLASPEHIRSALQESFSDRSAFKVTPDHWPRFLPWAMRFARQALPDRVRHNQQAISRLNRASIDAWKDVLRFARAQDELRSSGYLQLWEKAGQLQNAQAAQVAAREWGFDPLIVQGDALFELEPSLKRRLNHALYYPGAHHLGDTYETCLRLFECYRKQGGRFEQQQVWNVTPHRAGATLLLQGKRESYNKVVIAAGVWSKQLLEELDLSVPLAAERGYHLTLPGERSRISNILSSADRHIVLSPLDCGLRVVGFGEYANLDSKPLDKRYRQLKSHLNKLIRDIDTGKDKIETWMGIRPTLPDSLPVIDQHPIHPQIGMVFGHQHLGVTQAAISARLITSLMREGKHSDAWKPFAEGLDAYNVTRFKQSKLKPETEVSSETMDSDPQDFE